MGRRGNSKPLILAVMAAPLALGGCAMTSTYGTGELPEVALLHEVTGGLISKKKQPHIDYGPRAPLVMPPNDELPPPAEAASATDPNWPTDPNQPTALASASAEDDLSGAASREEYKKLRPLAGLLASNAGPATPNNDTDQERQATYDFINHAHQQHEAFGKALADANGYNTTERKYLTDPPLAYEQPAGSAPTEFQGIGKKRSFWQRLFPGGS